MKQVTEQPVFSHLSFATSLAADGLDFVLPPELEAGEPPEARGLARDEVRLMVIGERPRDDNRIRYPLNEAYERSRADRWVDWPVRPIGEHDGMPD